MVITSKINGYYTPRVGAGYIKRRALTRLRYYPFGVTEELLNDYLKAHFGITLPFACKNIIIKSKIETNTKDNTYTVTIMNTSWEQIARVITFGTGKVNGSKILRIIFNEINLIQ